MSIHLKFCAVSMKRGRKSFMRQFIGLLLFNFYQARTRFTDASDWKAIHLYSLEKNSIQTKYRKMLSFLISFPPFGYCIGLQHINLIESWGQMSHRQSNTNRWIARASYRNVKWYNFVEFQHHHCKIMRLIFFRHNFVLFW